MPAYMVEIAKWACQVCGSRATVEVYNGANSLQGRFCRAHGAKTVERLNRESKT